MKKILTNLMVAFFVFCSFSISSAQTLEDIANLYPLPENGYHAYEILLPALENEEDAKVQLLIGKMMTTDCNTFWFRGTLHEEVLPGWGYSYFVVEDIHGPFSTLMACPPESKKETFVTISGIPLQRYNSKVPLVIHVPEGFEVKYRIWNADKTSYNAKEK